MGLYGVGVVLYGIGMGMGPYGVGMGMVPYGVGWKMGPYGVGMGMGPLWGGNAPPKPPHPKPPELWGAVWGAVWGSLHADLPRHRSQLIFTLLWGGKGGGGPYRVNQRPHNGSIWGVSPIGATRDPILGPYGV